VTTLLLALLVQTEIGTSAVEITPPGAYYMAGYYHARTNTGVRDPLLAKAIVFRGPEKGALVICDLVAVHPELTERVRRRAAPASGIPAEHIVIAATHTHTGPAYERDLLAWSSKGAPDDDSVPARLVRGISDAVVQASKDAGPARLRGASGRQEEEISFCRRFVMKDGKVRTWANFRDPNVVKAANPIDPEVGLLAFCRPGEELPRALLVNFALHLDTLGGTAYSADFPHDLQLALREDFGPTFLSIFANGCCGDINHVNPRSEVRNKTDAIGRALATSVSAASSKLADLKPAPFAVRREVVNAPLQTATEDELAWAAKALEANPDGRKGNFLDTVRARKLQELEAHRKAGRAALGLEVHAFRVGADTAIVTLPGEVFVELGLAIKKGSPFARTLVVELANSCETNYIPKRDAYPLGGYEVENCVLAPGGGELLVDAALRLLDSLKLEGSR
jgi:hypothetical protein